jgi:hypothetical protein
VSKANLSADLSELAPFNAHYFKQEEGSKLTENADSL